MPIHKTIARTAFAWLIAVTVTLAGTAQAAPTPIQYSIDVAGIDSNEELGSPINALRFLNIGYAGHVVGLSWNVALHAIAPSWLSEIAVDISNANNDGLSLMPGFGANSSGDGSFSSGMVDLVASNQKFDVGNSGILRFEFFEAFSDVAGARDGFWRSGSLTVHVIPEPSSMALVLLALVGTGALTRRRRFS